MTCIASKANGEKCRADALQESQYCYNHSPEHAEQRTRIARKGGAAGGRGRPSVNPEAEEIRGQLKALYSALLAGRYAAGVCAVGVQILTCQLKVVELERKLKEQGELEQRLAELEQALLSRPEASEDDYYD